MDLSCYAPDKMTDTKRPTDMLRSAEAAGLGLTERDVTRIKPSMRKHETHRDHTDEELHAAIAWHHDALNNTTAGHGRGSAGAE